MRRVNALIFGSYLAAVCFPWRTCSGRAETCGRSPLSSTWIWPSGVLTGDEFISSIHFERAEPTEKDKLWKVEALRLSLEFPESESEEANTTEQGDGAEGAGEGAEGPGEGAARPGEGAVVAVEAPGGGAGAVLAGTAPQGALSEAKWQLVHLARTGTPFLSCVRITVSANSQRLPRVTRSRAVPSSPRLGASVATMCSLRVGGFWSSFRLGWTSRPADAEVSE